MTCNDLSGLIFSSSDLSVCVCVARFWIEQQSSLYRSYVFEMPVATLSHQGCPPCSGTGTQGQQFSDYNGMLQSFAERWLLTQNYTRQDITELRISCMLENIVVVDANNIDVREFGILYIPSKGPLQKRHPTADGRGWSVGALAGEVSRRLADTTAQVSRDPSLPGRLVGMGGTPRVAVADAATARGELH